MLYVVGKFTCVVLDMTAV